LIVTELRISNLRNLAEVSFAPHPRLNYFVGDNGAGKTSILESLVVLSRGRSFRTTQATELTGANASTFRVFATTRQDDDTVCRVGLEREGRHWRARKDSRDLQQISQLTRSLPLILMEPNSHLLVSGTPDYRRKYLDWGLFHVEHGFLETWGRYSRALKQRNAALRMRDEGLLDSLDSALVPVAQKLSDLRSLLTRRIQEQMAGILKFVGLEISKISITFQPGWTDGEYREVLNRDRERDLERGVTHHGPHRADLLMEVDENQAKAVLSRGEQKTLAAALLLAQAMLLARTGEKPVILMDDLASEFDERHFRAVLEQALSLGGQVWVSGTWLPDLPSERSVFHVEHGALQEMV
jgi:DNA replication and repair protein RecF